MAAPMTQASRKAPTRNVGRWLAAQNATCETALEGPSFCFSACDPLATPSGCPAAEYCYGSDAGGDCLPGCNVDSDCPVAFGCFVGNHSCYPIGSDGGAVGGPCQSDSDCPTGGLCGFFVSLTKTTCSFPCGGLTLNLATCPSGAFCAFNQFCLPTCAAQSDCDLEAGYVCQPFAQASAAATSIARAVRAVPSCLTSCASRAASAAIQTVPAEARPRPAARATPPAPRPPATRPRSARAATAVSPPVPAPIAAGVRERAELRAPAVVRRAAAHQPVASQRAQPAVGRRPAAIGRTVAPRCTPELRRPAAVARAQRPPATVSGLAR